MRKEGGVENIEIKKKMIEKGKKEVDGDDIEEIREIVIRVKRIIVIGEEGEKKNKRQKIKIGWIGVLKRIWVGKENVNGLGKKKEVELEFGEDVVMKKKLKKRGIVMMDNKLEQKNGRKMKNLKKMDFIRERKERNGYEVIVGENIKGI